jgi:hypothetical protein
VAAIKLLVHPLLVFLLCAAARHAGAPLSPFEVTVLTLAAALPSASNVSLLAERYGADNGRIARIKGDLLHASAESLNDYMAKQNRYTTLQAEALHARGQRAGALQLVLSPLVRFVRFYIVKLGFLDGVAGLVHIAIGCFNSFMKYAKLLALEQRRVAVPGSARAGGGVDGPNP